MGYIGQQITTVFPTSISVDSATIKGDTTIGDASAADKKILFDGNAQDFHIGLDDSTDSLTIGLGSALGTTSHMIFDSTGAITKPLQPAFNVNLGGTSTSALATDGSALTLAFNTERFDQNADFASNTFTAPVTGKYVLAVHLRIDNVDTAATYYIPTIITSNQAYRGIINPKFASDVAYLGMTTTVVADLDASDTVTVTIQQSGGSSQSTVDGGSDYTYFTGYLLG